MARRGMDLVKLEFFTDALIGFADYHSIGYETYNNGLHIRLFGKFTTLDVWPSTGKYYVLQVSLETGLSDRMHEKGIAPYDHKQLDQFLTELLLKGR